MAFQNERFYGAEVSHCRATYKGCGYDPLDLNRPHIGVANTFSESSPGHVHLRQYVDAIKNAIWQAGGIPFEFGVPSTCAEISIGTTDCMRMDLAMRDVVCASIELVSKIQHFNGLVLTSGCDNIVPGTLLAAARLDIPTIICTSGPMLAGHMNQKKFLLGDVNEFVFGELAKDSGDTSNLLKGEMSACPTVGACPLMGTANTMQILTEALGMTLPGSSTIPSVYTDKLISCRRIGNRIVQMVLDDLRPSQIITRQALENAARVDMAIGGSTNAIMHLIALANELDIPFEIGDFNTLSRTTPCIVNCRPTGTYSVDDLYDAGGVPQICKQLEPLMHREAMNVCGKCVGELLDETPGAPSDVIRSLDCPVNRDGGLAVLFGNLAENGCVIRASTVKESMRHVRGPAKVYESDDDAFHAIVEGEVRKGDVVVVRYSGPVGAPGMVEVMLSTDALVGLGLEEDICLITDGRFSGFNHGPIVGHVSPEAAVGGVIAIVENGDMIELDIDNRSIHLDLPDEMIEERMRNLVLPPLKARKGFMRTYAKNCLSADKGAAMQSWD